MIITASDWKCLEVEWKLVPLCWAKSLEGRAAKFHMAKTVYTHYHYMQPSSAHLLSGVSFSNVTGNPDAGSPRAVSKT
jgi:hypothetical protein